MQNISPSVTVVQSTVTTVAVTYCDKTYAYRGMLKIKILW